MIMIVEMIFSYRLFFVKIFVGIDSHLFNGVPRGVVVELGYRGFHAFLVVGAGVDDGDVEDDQSQRRGDSDDADATEERGTVFARGILRLQVGSLHDLLHHTVGDVDLPRALQVRQLL